jgi:uncharacterized membrane protein
MAIPPHGLRPASTVSGRRWPILACTAGLMALAAAFLPFGVGLVAVVFAGVGIAAGIAATTRATPAGHAGLAGIGAAMSATAIVVAVVMAAVYQTGTDVDARPTAAGSLGVTDNLDEILRNQLRVSFGKIEPTGWTLLPVTATNKLDRGASFHLVVAGFVGDTEIARDTEFLTLAPKTTQHVRMFHRYRIDKRQIAQLRKAHFRVVDASTFWHTD